MLAAAADIGVLTGIPKAAGLDVDHALPRSVRRFPVERVEKLVQHDLEHAPSVQHSGKRVSERYRVRRHVNSLRTVRTSQL